MRFKRSLHLLVFFVLLGLPALSFADDQAQGLFIKANAFYAKAQYDEALKTYRKLTDEGYQSAPLYFNMGNASYKSGDVASAILYYERARKLAPADEDINFNLKYANLKTTDKIDEAPELFLNRWWKGIILSLPLATLSVWSIVFILAASGILILYFFAGSVVIKKVSFYAACLFLFAGIYLIFVSNRQVNYFDDHRQAIIFSPSVDVKNGPVERSATEFVIHDGTKVDLLENNNDWVKIKLANGSEGWIRKDAAKEI
jgi:tetratricopeptide (TPR) repeat protein